MNTIQSNIKIASEEMVKCQLQGKLPITEAQNKWQGTTSCLFSLAIGQALPKTSFFWGGGGLSQTKPCRLHTFAGLSGAWQDWVARRHD
jgi:hypothetical protein